MALMGTCDRGRACDRVLGYVSGCGGMWQGVMAGCGGMWQGWGYVVRGQACDMDGYMWQEWDMWQGVEAGGRVWRQVAGCGGMWQGVGACGKGSDL